MYEPLSHEVTFVLYVAMLLKNRLRELLMMYRFSLFHTLLLALDLVAFFVTSYISFFDQYSHHNLQLIEYCHFLQVPL